MKKFSVIVLSAFIATSGMLAAAEGDQNQNGQGQRVEQGAKSGDQMHAGDKKEDKKQGKKHRSHKKHHDVRRKHTK